MNIQDENPSTQPQETPTIVLTGLRFLLAQYIHLNPTVSSLQLRGLAQEFGTNPENISKTLWQLEDKKILKAQMAPDVGRNAKRYVRSEIPIEFAESTPRARRVERTKPEAPKQELEALPALKPTETPLETLETPKDVLAPIQTLEITPTSLESLVDSFAGKIANYVAEKVVLSIALRLQELTLELPESKGNPLETLQNALQTITKLPAREVKKKVLIVGLLPQQAGLIQTEFGQAMEISFVESNAPTQQIASMVKGSDLILMMKNFLNHDTVDAFKKHPNCVRLSGGMTALRDKLTAFYVEDHA